VVGRVCMDQTMVDVTDIPGVKMGDEVTVFGPAGGETAAPDNVTTQLLWEGDWRPTLRTQEGPATDDEGRFRPIEGWRRNILGEAARLDDPAAGRTIEILTSQPEIRIVRHDGQLALLCGDSRPAPLDDETLYCQKDVYRF